MFLSLPVGLDLALGRGFRCPVSPAPPALQNAEQVSPKVQYQRLSFVHLDFSPQGTGARVSLRQQRFYSGGILCLVASLLATSPFGLGYCIGPISNAVRPRS